MITAVIVIFILATAHDINAISHLRRQPSYSQEAQSTIISSIFSDPNKVETTNNNNPLIYQSSDASTNDDPAIEESEAQKIGYIIDQHAQTQSCHGCNSQAKVDQAIVRKFNKTNDRKIKKNNEKKISDKNEVALKIVQKAEAKVEDAQQELSELTSLSKAQTAETTTVVNPAIEEAEEELAKAEEEEEEAKIDAEEKGADAADIDAAERGTLANEEGASDKVKHKEVGSSSSKTTGSTSTKSNRHKKPTEMSKSSHGLLDKLKHANETPPDTISAKAEPAGAADSGSGRAGGGGVDGGGVDGGGVDGGGVDGGGVDGGGVDGKGASGRGDGGGGSSDDGKKEDDDEKGPIPIPNFDLASIASGGKGKACPCKPFGKAELNPLELSLNNAEKALKFAWEMAPGWCMAELPPKNIPTCKTPMKSACCCECPKKKKLECMIECTAGMDDMGDTDGKLQLCYCGFACQGCDHSKVPMNAVANDYPSGTPAGIVPSWWLATMHAKLELIKNSIALND
jgi:hypothetical protein